MNYYLLEKLQNHLWSLTGVVLSDRRVKKLMPKKERMRRISSISSGIGRVPYWDKNK